MQHLPINLQYNHIGINGCKYLKKLNVHTLDLSCNPIDDMCCEYLKNMEGVHTLHLMNTQIKCIGYKYLKDIKVVVLGLSSKYLCNYKICEYLNNINVPMINITSYNIEKEQYKYLENIERIHTLYFNRKGPLNLKKNDYFENIKIHTFLFNCRIRSN